MLVGLDIPRVLDLGDRLDEALRDFGDEDLLLFPSAFEALFEGDLASPEVDLAFFSLDFVEDDEMSSSSMSS